MKASELTFTTWREERYCSVCRKRTMWHGNTVRKECSECNEGYYYQK